MKKKFIDYYMAIAEITAKLSYARRLQVGAVIVRENQILATGYNGMPAGWDNNCEYAETSANELEVDQLKTRPEVLHAESNALMKVAKSTESSEDATLFCTHAPCIECAKLIYQSGIKNLYYRDQYKNTDGLEFLKQGGVNAQRYRISN